MSGLRRAYLHGPDLAEAQLRLADGTLAGSVTVGDAEHAVEAVVRRLDEHCLYANRVEVRVNGRTVRATVVTRGDSAWVCIDGATVKLELAEPGAQAAAGGLGAGFAVSPMSGVVAKMSVDVGAQVASGDELFVVEAMKMEYVVTAPRDVEIRAVQFKAGDRVELGDEVVLFEMPNDESPDGEPAGAPQ